MKIINIFINYNELKHLINYSKKKSIEILKVVVSEIKIGILYIIIII